MADYLPEPALNRPASTETAQPNNTPDAPAEAQADDGQVAEQIFRRANLSHWAARLTIGAVIAGSLYAVGSLTGPDMVPAAQHLLASTGKAIQPAVQLAGNICGSIRDTFQTGVRSVSDERWTYAKYVLGATGLFSVVLYGIKEVKADREAKAGADEAAAAQKAIDERRIDAALRSPSAPRRPRTPTTQA